MQSRNKPMLGGRCLKGDLSLSKVEQTFLHHITNSADSNVIPFGWRPNIPSYSSTPVEVRREDEENRPLISIHQN